MRHLLTLLLAASGIVGAQTRSGFITTSDKIQIHYLEAGKGSAIVLVPGWTMPAWIWEDQIAYFSRNYRVVAMDPRSQGESTKAADGNYQERRAQDIKELVDQLKLGPAVLVGWSLGVPELMAYVEQFGTATVKGLVLVDGVVGEDIAPERTLKSFTFLAELQKNRARFTDRFVRGMYKHPRQESYYKKVIAASFLTPTNTAVVLSANSFAHPDWRSTLPKVDRPVLFVGQTGFKAQGEILKAKLKSVRVELIPDCGHAVFADDPKRFNEVFESFLKSLR